MLPTKLVNGRVCVVHLPVMKMQRYCYWGLGLDEFSMSAANLLRIKKIIREASYSQCREIAQAVLDLSYSHEVLELLKKYNSQANS